MDFIKPIQKELEKEMHKHCQVFMAIGSNRETPRYYNFGGFNIDTRVLTIRSTQNPNLFFKISTKFRFVSSADFWPQFKNFRTKFLQDNYPTISPV